MSYDLRIERMIDSTPEEVFTAFIEPDAMIEWYRDGPDFHVNIIASDLSVGGTTIVEFGPGDTRYREEMTYTAIERPGRVGFDERFTMPDGSSFDTSITVTFEAKDAKTLLTIVQTGFPDAASRDAHEGGWPGFLTRLDHVVTSRLAR